MADRQSTDHVQIIADRGITARKESLQAQTVEQSQLEKAHRGRTAAATTQLKTDVVALKLDFRQECTRARSEFLESLPPTEASQTTITASAAATLQDLEELSKTIPHGFTRECTDVTKQCLASLGPDDASRPDSSNEYTASPYASSTAHAPDSMGTTNIITRISE